LAVKENHKTLHDEIKTYFDAVIDESFMVNKSAYVETVEKGHGRIETRRYWITEDVGWLSGIENWTDLVSIGVVESERYIISTDTTSIERRYFIMSLRGKRMKAGWDEDYLLKILGGVLN